MRKVLDSNAMTDSAFNAKRVPFFLHWMRLMGAETWRPEVPFPFRPSGSRDASAFWQHAPKSTSEGFSSFCKEQSQWFTKGLSLYQTFPRSSGAPLSEIWREGPASLQYMPASSTAHAAVLFVPAPMNKPDIFRLPGGGLCAFLARQGVASYLLDWGESCAPSLEAYLEQTLFPAMEAVQQHTSVPIFLFGYCMGAISVLGALQHQPQWMYPKGPIAGACLLSPLWDLRTYPIATQLFIDNAFELYEKCPAPDVTEPSLISLFLNLLQPWAIFEKYARFSQYTDPEQQRQFVQMEDWLNDLYALSTCFIQETVRPWFAENALLSGDGTVFGEKLHPESLSLPMLITMPLQDRVVPPASGQSLCKRLPKAASLYPTTGHIGALVGRNAQEHFWKPCWTFMRSVMKGEGDLCGPC
ncbi:MAG: alpha/beta hydrolase [Holosporales bacterium]|jgi:poly(3-hydroxyalkanoate) synthetase|nr:alpha/beta hydrolase [Holosporales bacterium]